MARAMKDSGIEWIGDIPEGWSTVRNKQLFIEISDKTNETDNYDLLSVSEYYGVGLRKERKDENDFLSRAETLEGYKKCKKNDIVMNIMLAWKRAIGVSNYDGIVSPAYCVYRKKSANTNSRYFNNLFRTDIYSDLFKQYSTGIIDSRLRLYPDKFFQLYSHFPPLPEQQAIADYLDLKCSLIDSTIEKQKAVIEKLKHYKQSLITEAVTKGLDPTAKMKPSGIKWIGDIPEGWEVRKLKGLLKFPLQYGANESGDEYDERLPRYIRITDISIDNKLKYENKLSLSREKAKIYILYDGDILFARSGATVGKTFIYKSEYGESSFAGYLIRATTSDELYNSFVYYYTLSLSYEEWKNRIFIQATIQNIGANKYGNMEIPLPPLQEQQAIVDYLDRKCILIENIINSKQKLVEKLTAYKKSLIYEYITGKSEITDIG